MWKCPKCGTAIEDSFDVCWSCGTSAEGVEDPGFVTADEAAPIYEPSVEDKLEHLEDLELPEPPSQVVECYLAGTATEAKFIVDRLSEQGIPAMIQGGKVGSLGYMSPSLSPRIMVRSQDYVSARKFVEEYDRRRQSRPDNEK
ncbi:putative signal transducing protein [Singulisphaera sp. PoT]|uniref:putative signal transducing protein n=1 Tax=Singulisphaera sp. PoT TaxID=3411797 RepID=UPI003BF4B791